jgi:hypothetical protein
LVGSGRIVGGTLKETSGNSGGAHKGSVGSKSSRHYLRSPSEFQAAAPIKFGLCCFKKWIAKAQCNRSGNDG